MTRKLRSRVREGRLAAGLLLLSLAGAAHASIIDGSLTADNAFFAYISANNATLGTLVAQGNNWGGTYGFSAVPLTPGQDYYLQIEGINYGGPGAIIGSFTLSDTNFQFSNGTQSLATNLADWSATFNDANSNPSSQQPWVTPTGGVTSEGVNGVGPWGFRSGIDASALWIDGAINGLSTCGNCTVDFSTPITYVGGAGTVPEPGTFVLFAGALALAAVFRFRRPAGNRA